MLDRGETAALREQIEMELDGELLAACMLSNDRSGGGSQDVVETARTVLRRIATYRSEKTPSYPKAYASLDPSARSALQGCLDEVRRSSGK